MAETSPKASEKQKTREDELDRMLNAALAKYAAVEPRAGLEDRILANLHADHGRSVGRGWWQWRLGGAVAVIVIVGVLAWRSSRIPDPAIAVHPPAAIQHPSIQKTNPAAHGAGEVTVAKRSPRRRPAQRRARATTAVAVYPKLDQFPSPQPLSVEEIALTEYVKNFPKEAQLVAQAEEEFEFETEKEMEMKDGGSETGPSGPVQQER